jgi:excisionase family DNA binding protein
MDNKLNLLTVSDIAERLSLSEPHARKLCRTGYLPAFKLGSKDYRIDETDLNSFIRSLKPSKVSA